jgi:hypothetical protein
MKKNGRLWVLCERECRVGFPDTISAKKHFDAFCANSNNGWKECSIAKMFEEYYDRKDIFYETVKRHKSKCAQSGNTATERDCMEGKAKG